MPKKSALKGIDKYEINKRHLESYFKEAASNGELLWPDDAMKKLIHWWNMYVQVEKIDILEMKSKHPRLNESAFAKEIHHLAVDLFYKTYFEQKAGAPKINDEHLDLLLKLEAQGLTHLEIAKEIDLPTNTKQEKESSKGIVQKRIASAKRRKPNK